MYRNKMLAVAVCLVLGITVAGCPIPNSQLVGAWKVHTYNCNQSMDNYGVAFFYSDGSSEFFIDATYYDGEWDLAGAIVTMTAVDLGGSGDDGTFQAALDGNMLISGTWTVENTTGTGCWSAEKVDF